MNKVEFVITSDFLGDLHCTLELLNQHVIGDPSIYDYVFYCDEFLIRDSYLKELLNTSKTYFHFVYKALLRILSNYIKCSSNIAVILNGDKYNLSDFLSLDKNPIELADFVDFIFTYLVTASNEVK